MKLGEEFPCPTCGKTWTGHRRCHCATCHESFSSVSAFDQHRRRFACRPPGECGLVEVDGYWSWPEGRPDQAVLGLGARAGGDEGDSEAPGSGSAFQPEFALVPAPVTST